MCVPPIGRTSVSRRRLMGTVPLGAAALALGASTPARATGTVGMGAPGPGGEAPSMDLSAPGSGSVAGDRITFLGTVGGPPPEVGAAGISTVLTVQDRNYVVDAGRAAVTQYVNSGLKMADLDTVFVTHLHADHVADLYNFVNLAAFGVNDADDGVTKPFRVYGPSSAGNLPPAPAGTSVVNPQNPVPGIVEFMDSMQAANAYSHNLFIRDSGVPDPRTMVSVHEITPPPTSGSSSRDTAPRMRPFQVYQDDLVTVSATLVPHGPVYPSYALRFDTPTHSVVFSGDTAYSENLIELAHGADVLVHEVIDLSFYAEIGLTGALLDHLRESHTDVSEIGGLAQRAQVSTLALTHLVPGKPGARTIDQWYSKAAVGFTGNVVVGTDLAWLGLM